MRLVEFVLTSLVVEITPGPNMGYLAALSLAHGRRSGLFAVAGVALGLALYGLFAAFGLAALVDAVPAVYQGLRFGGVLYLLYLAWDSWRGDPAAGSAPPEDGRAFRRSLLVNLLNPKAAIFYLAILPGFVDPDAGSPVAQNLGLVAIYVAIATLVHAAIVLGAAALRPWFTRGSAREAGLRRGLAVALAAIAFWLLWSTRR